STRIVVVFLHGRHADDRRVVRNAFVAVAACAFLPPARHVTGAGHDSPNRFEKKSPKPWAMSTMPLPSVRNTSAASPGRNAIQNMRNATPPHTRIFLTIAGRPPPHGDKTPWRCQQRGYQRLVQL